MERDFVLPDWLITAEMLITANVPMAERRSWYATLVAIHALAETPERS